MTPALNWSERYDPASGNAWRDCSHGACLGVIEDGGYTSFPLGARTWEEREALEDAEGLLEPPSTALSYDPNKYEEQGTIGYGVIDRATKARYGIVLRPATDLGTLLARTDVSVAVQGQGDLPYGHCGPHSIRVVPIGNGKVLVFDPRAPMNSAGVECPVSTILSFHAALAPYAQLRYAVFGEFAQEKPMRQFTLNGGEYRAVVKADSRHYGVPLDGRAGPWPVLTPGTLFVGPRITLDAPIAGGLPGEDRTSAFLTRIGTEMCVVLAKDVDFAPLSTDATNFKDRAIAAIQAL